MRLRRIVIADESSEYSGLLIFCRYTALTRQVGMSGKVKLTAERVACFSCPAGAKQAFLWDSDAPGLALRATAAGAKAYIFQASLFGQTMRITIGSPAAWPLESQLRSDPNNPGKKIEHQRGARAEARRLKGLVDQGVDPRNDAADRAAKTTAARADNKLRETTVASAWASYVEHHKKRWGARHLADHINLAHAGGDAKKRGNGQTVPGVLASLMKLRLADVTAGVLTDWQATEAAARANNARQGFELFRAFWRWLASRDDFKRAIDPSAVEDKDLRAEVPTRQSKRFDVLQKAHLESWFRAVLGLDSPVVSAYLQALLLTGARREEVAALRWEDVDFRWNVIWLGDKVTGHDKEAGEGRKVPLTPYLATLLQNLKRLNETPPKVRNIRKVPDELRAWKPSPWVFFSRTAAGGRITEPRIAHNRALSVAGLDHVTLHGLRRTFASLAEWVEMPRGVVAQIMGHAPTATAERHYIDRPLELLAIWHTRYEAWILATANIKLADAPDQVALRVVS